MAVTRLIILAAFASILSEPRPALATENGVTAGNGAVQSLPLSPAGETTLRRNRAFETECLSALNEIRALGDIHTAGSTLTSNKAWGPVFRVDFTLGKETDPTSVDRLICWRQANGQIGLTYAIGQFIPKLPTR